MKTRIDTLLVRPMTRGPGSPFKEEEEVHGESVVLESDHGEE